jgi:uroporphyrinogen decarboxylase
VESKEIVQKTLNFDKPNRVARSFGESDMVVCSYQVETQATSWIRISDRRWERIDEWGNIWGRLDDTSKGEVIRGALEGDVTIETLNFPDFNNPSAYHQAAGIAVKYPDKWIIGSMPGFTFNIARKLYKLENYLCELMLEPDAIHLLHNRIDEMLLQMIANYARAGVDCIMFPEDWGTQTQTMISPQLWCKEFRPRFVKLCAAAHDAGLRVFMHSCGAIGAIIPDLIRSGIDVLQFDQPTLHGIDQLAAWQADQPITYWCPVDIQRTLQTHNERLIEAEAQEILQKLWQGRGGFIAGFYPDEASIGLEPYWQQIACNTFLKYGRI